MPSIAEARAYGVFEPTFADEYNELFYQYTEPQIIDSSAIERTFGLHATPLDEASRATVAWYRTMEQAAVRP